MVSTTTKLKVTLAGILLAVAMACGSSQQRTEATGTNAQGGTPTTSSGSDSEDGSATNPAQVSGSFLIDCGYADGPIASGEDAKVGCRLTSGGVKVDISALQVSAAMKDGDTDAGAMDPAAATSFWHFTKDVKTADFTTQKVVVSLTPPGAASASTLEFKLSDIDGGTPASNLTAAAYFNFPDAPLAAALDSSSYCGVDGAVHNDITAPGKTTTLANMVPGSAVEVATPPTDTDACFVPLANYVGTSNGSYLAQKDQIGEYLAAGPTDSGSPGCYFVVVTGGVGTSVRLLVLTKDAVTSVNDLKATIYASRCP